MAPAAELRGGGISETWLRRAALFRRDLLVLPTRKNNRLRCRSVSVLHAFGDQSLCHDFPLQSVHWNHYESLFVMAWEYLLLASSCFVSNFIRHCLEFQTFSNRLEIRTLCVFLSFQDTERMSLRRQACAGQWWELGFCSSTCMLVLSRCLLKLSGLHLASGSSDSSAPELNMRSRVPARTHVLLMS